MTIKKAESTNFAFLYYTRLASGVVTNHKWGVFQKKEPRYALRFINNLTGQQHQTTDYNLKLNRRNKKIQLFNDFYEPYFHNKQISILCFIVYADAYSKISDFIDYQKKTKLFNSNIMTGSHIWICDIGKKNRRPHYHLFIITEHITIDLFNLVYSNNNEEKYKVKMMDARYGLFIYCKKKDLFGKFKGKCCGGSNVLTLPSKK